MLAVIRPRSADAPRRAKPGRDLTKRASCGRIQSQLHVKELLSAQEAGLHAGGMKSTPSPHQSLLPDAEALLELERRCRYLGTGLDAEELLGPWQLVQTWTKGQNQPAAASSWLLRSLAAQLRITAGPSPGQLRLANRVCLGAFSLEFSGQGQLKGRRPLLVFWFDRLQLTLGSIALVDRAISKPETTKLPFFALIGRGNKADGQGTAARQWLAARGRGGGLALWCLPEPAPETLQPKRG